MTAPLINTDDFRPLDLLACYGTDAASKAISWGTGSLLAPSRLRLGPSHVAVICVECFMLIFYDHIRRSYPQAIDQQNW